MKDPWEIIRLIPISDEAFSREGTQIVGVVVAQTIVQTLNDAGYIIAPVSMVKTYPPKE